MLRIDRTFWGEWEEVKVLNDSTGFSASILPALGGMVHSFNAVAGGDVIPVLSSYADPDNLKNDLNRYFCGAKLFPFPNRIKNGRYEWKGVRHQLSVNFSLEGNSIHGLVYDQPFILKSSRADEQSADLELEYDYNGEKQGFPFPFLIHINYRIGQNRIEIATRVKNTGSCAFPAGDGWHPYFRLKGPLEQYQLQLPPCHKLECSENIPTGSEVEFSTFNHFTALEQQVFDDPFHLTGLQRDIILRDPAHSIELRLDMGNYSYLQIYTPPSRDCIALEPMSCPPNAFQSKKDLALLQPGAWVEWITGWEISSL